MKNILITGVSGGMGLATAKKLTDNGFHVFGLDIKEPSEAITNLTYIKTDLRDSNSIQNAFHLISKEIDKLTAVINMAGIYDLNSLLEMSEEEFIRIFDINVFSIYRINKQFASLLEKGGKIIVVSSELAPLDPLPFTGIYAITKSTIEKYAYSLRMEVQLLDLKVSVIRPGAVDTSLLDVSTDRIEKFQQNTKIYKYNAEKFKEITDKVESRKISPTKIANIAYKIINKKNPRYIYKINRNPLLLLLNILPQHLQNRIIKKILKEKH